MNSSPKTTVPSPVLKVVADPTSHATPSAAAPAAGCHTHAPSANADPACCVVHRLEEAVQLTEAIHLTDEQKTRIGELTKKQCEESHALCTQAHEAHKATHAQILALLTPEQQQKLHALETAG
jgi:Spy/CpxP family protein refolding chaperone